MAAPSRDEGPGRQIREALRRLRDLTAEESIPEADQRAGAEEIGRFLRNAAGEAGDIELVIGTNRITYGDDAVYKSDARESNLAFELFRQGLRRVTFKAGVTDDEVLSFVHNFGQCREIEKVDEDFVSTLWRENLPGVHYVAIDGFTEKIFMADEAFMATFRGVVDDLCPGLVDMAEDDEPDARPRPRVTLDTSESLRPAYDQQRQAEKGLAAVAAGLREQLRAAFEGLPPLEHLFRLQSSFVVKSPCALPAEELGQGLLLTLEAMWRVGGATAFADGARTLLALTDRAAEFPEAVAAHMRVVRHVTAGRPALVMVAKHFDAERHDVTAWLRWYFITAGAVSAPDLLGLINTVPPGAAQDFLKDLLRRQGTSSLAPWAERLNDDNPAVVREVLEVILGSELGDQAQSLLLGLLKHKAAEVRARAIDGLRGAYNQPLRQALLPLLRDPSDAVRRAVLSRFSAAGDVTVATYVAATVKSPMFIEFDEDEQRQFFEALSSLGGERHLDVYRERLNLAEAKESGLNRLLRRGGNVLYDTTERRAALSGLAMLGTPPAIALIRECHAKADLELAAQCEVALRLAARGGGQRPTAAPIAAHVPSGENSAAIVAAGQDKLGQRVIFEVGAFKVEPPQRPRPSPVAIQRASATPAPIRPVMDAAPTPAMAPSALARADLSITELPLLAVGEVFLPADERRLRAEPSQFDDGKFTLNGLRCTLVGIEAAPAEGPVPRQIQSSRAGGRLVERPARTAAHADWTHQPEASLTDILSSYLDEETAQARPPEAPPLPPPSPQPPVARPAARAPAEPVSPPPRPPTAPMPSTAARTPAGPVPPAATPAPTAKKGENLDDVLKAFLDLDLGD